MARTETTWYLAICMDCRPIFPQPFTNEADRDEWAKAHGATGHEVELGTEVLSVLA